MYPCTMYHCLPRRARTGGEGRDSNPLTMYHVSCKTIAGRGGLALAVKDATLHQGLYDMLKIVCACNTFSASVSRFCYFGCYW